MKLYLIIPTLVAAGMVQGQTGAPFTALGRNLANPASDFALANNPGAMLTQAWSAGFSGTNRFTGTALYNGSIAGHARLKHTSLGAAAYYQGTSYFSYQTYTVQIAQQFAEKFSAGFAAGSRVVYSGDFAAPQHRFTGSLGCQSKLNENTLLSVVLRNPWYGTSAASPESAEIHLATQVKLNQNAHMTLQFRNFQNSAIAGISMRYNASKGLQLMGALQTGNEPISAGLLYLRKSLSFGFSSAFHSMLGFSPTFSLQWHP